MLRKFVFSSHQNKKCDFYWKNIRQPRCCLKETICSVKLPVIKCPLYGTRDCCELGGNITLHCMTTSVHKTTILSQNPRFQRA